MNFKFSVLSCVLFLLGMNASGQVFKGSILDRATRAPLSFCSIGIVGKEIGGVSHADGTFEIDVAGAHSLDTLTINYIGYEPIQYQIKNLTLNSPQEILLQEKPTVLNAVTVRADGVSYLSYGDPRKNGKGFNGWGGAEHAGKGRQIGKQIQVHDRILLGSVAIKIEENTFDSVLVRINLYKIGPDGKPDQPLNSRDVLAVIRKKDKWAEISLREQSIQATDDFCVALEWLEAWGGPARGSMFTISRAPSTPGVSFFKNSHFINWHRSQGENAPAMYVNAHVLDKLSADEIRQNEQHRRPAVVQAPRRVLSQTLVTPLTAQVVNANQTYAYIGKGPVKKIGYTKPGSSTGGFTGIAPDANKEQGTLIQVAAPTSVVDFNFHTKFNSFDSVLIMLNFYTVNTDGVTLEPYLQQPVVFKIAGDKGWVRFDLSPFHIVLTQDVVVTMRLLEAVTGDGKSKDFYLSRVSDATTYSRDLSEPLKWTKKTDSAPAFYMSVRDQKPAP